MTEPLKHKGLKQGIDVGHILRSKGKLYELTELISVYYSLFNKSFIHRLHSMALPVQREYVFGHSVFWFGRRCGSSQADTTQMAQFRQE